MAPFLQLAWFFIVFEFIQIIFLERYIGVRALRADLEPRDLPLPLWIAVTAAVLAKLYLLWMVSLLFDPFARYPALVMLGATAAGFFARRSTGMRGALVVLTFETAIRVGMLIAMLRMLGMGSS